MLRDHADHHHHSTQPTPVQGQSPAPGLPNRQPNGPQIQPHPTPLHQHVHQTFRFARPGQVPGVQNGQVPVPGFPQPQAPLGALTPQMIAQQQHQMHQTMTQWMNQLQREANYRHIVAQGQQARAAMGMHGIQDQAANPTAAGNPPVQGQNGAGPQPEGHSYIREAVGPNGQHWRIAVNETVIQPPNIQGRSTPGQNGLSTADVQGILRNADANQATQATLAMTNAMHRSASGASLASLGGQRAGPGVTVPRRPGSARPASGAATPDPTRTPSHGTTVSANASRSQPSQGQPEVYILSSPAGPRALLINNPTEMYFTPSARYPIGPPQLPFPHLSHLSPWDNHAANNRQRNAVPTPQGQQAQQYPVPVRWTDTPQQQQQQQQPQNVPVQVRQQVEVRVAPGGAQLHPNNPGAGALAAAVWPHIWLLIRLAAFVWWFTAADTSWSRWITIIALATAVFLLNTGLLNGMANQAWDPFRRHLEGLIPLADPNQARNRAANPQVPAGAPQQDNNHPAGRQPNPDPAQVAARLVAQRRDANAGWLMEQVRRLERAGLLFLASIAPGVAERHIAHLEAEARAAREEQERIAREAREAREAAEAAAAEAAAAAANPEGAEGSEANGEEAVPTGNEAQDGGEN